MGFCLCFSKLWKINLIQFHSERIGVTAGTDISKNLFKATIVCISIEVWVNWPFKDRTSQQWKRKATPRNSQMKHCCSSIINSFKQSKGGSCHSGVTEQCHSQLSLVDTLCLTLKDVEDLAVHNKIEGKKGSRFVSSTKLKCHYVSLFLGDWCGDLPHPRVCSEKCDFTKVHYVI